MNPQTPRIASDYTTRAGYMANYRKRNREAINARKRRWREERKQTLNPVTVLSESVHSEATAKALPSGNGEAREKHYRRIERCSHGKP